MKTLKKTLSLTLVFALVFSLMSFAFAAPTAKTTAAELSDFTDKDQLTYTEAADYLIAAGVVKGDTDTTLNPKGDLTREQAAKLIAYACLGQVAADNLKASVAPFNDVAADRWSAGYIAYCQKQGIINGYGDGNFGPADKVTGYQFGKMLLCSIGYGVNGEFTGAGWDLEVAKLALAYGIFDGNTTGASSNAANREEAFLYTFNTLSKLCAVSYNKTLGIYYVPGSNVTKTNPMSATIGQTPDNRVDTVGAVKFGMLRQADIDDFGNPAHVWTLNKAIVTDTYPNDSIKVLGTIVDGTTISAATTNTNSKYIASKSTNGVTYFYNGAEVPEFDPAVAVVAGDLVEYNNTLYVITTGYGPDAWDAGKAAEYSVKGATVKLMAGTGANVNKVEKVSIIEKTVAVLTGAPVVTTAGSVTNVKVPGVVNTVTASKYVKGYEGLAKDDVVLWYKSGSTYHIEKATAVTGKLTAYVLNTVPQLARVTIGSSNYFISQLTDAAGNDVLTNGLNVGTVANFQDSEAYTYYLDDNGFLCYYVAADDAKTLTTTLFVSKAGAEQIDGTTEFAYALTDGTAGVAKASTKGEAPADNTFYTFSKLADGTYKLGAIANQAQFETYVADTEAPIELAEDDYSYSITAKSIRFLTKHTMEGGDTTWADAATSTAQINIGGNKDITGNSSTIFMYYDADAKTYTVKTGIANALAYDVSNTTNVYVYTDANGVALLVVAKGSISSVTSSTNTVFPVSATQIGKDANGLDTYTCYAYVNGATTATPVISYAPIALGNLYYVTSYAANGYPQTAVVALDSTALPTVTGRAATDAKVNVALDSDLSTNTTKWAKGILSLADYTAVVENKAVVGTGASYVVPSDVKVYFVDARDTSNILYQTADAAFINTIDYTGATQTGIISVETSDTDATIAAIYMIVK